MCAELFRGCIMNLYYLQNIRHADMANCCRVHRDDEPLYSALKCNQETTNLVEVSGVLESDVITPKF